MSAEAPVSAANVRQLFLQAMLSRRTVSAALAKLLWRKCADAVRAADRDVPAADVDRPEAWDEFVKGVAAAISPLDLDFRHQQDELTGTQLYAIVNKRGDEIAQLATEYSAVEIAYFKALVEQIMLAPREAYSVSSMLALREVSELKPSMPKAQAEVVLASLVVRGWLLRSKRGRYSLSARTLLELQSYLRAEYPDEVLECTICLEIVTRGVACYTRACKTRMHAHCRTLFTRRGGACPACSADWTGANADKLFPVGEGAAREGAEQRQTRAADEDADGEADEDEPDAEVASQRSSAPPTQPARKAGKGKGKARRNRIDEDEEKEAEEEAEDDDADADDGTPPPTKRGTRSRRK